MKGTRGREPKVLENEDRREHKTGPEKLKGRNKKGEGAIEKKKGRLGGENTKMGRRKGPADGQKQVIESRDAEGKVKMLGGLEINFHSLFGIFSWFRRPRRGSFKISSPFRFKVVFLNLPVRPRSFPNLRGRVFPPFLLCFLNLNCFGSFPSRNCSLFLHRWPEFPPERFLFFLFLSFSSDGVPETMKGPR